MPGLSRLIHNTEIKGRN